ncbi:hypothetical protein [Stutzerimonas stutzeri]|nr:hypothetical protein [Stutzerimonas stutzeri]
MNDIWNEAPEGATHYTPANETECLNAVYWRVIEGVFVKAWAVLGNGSLSECKSGCEFDLTRPDVVTRPWTGEGLPPVGTVCEAWHNGSAQGVVEVRYAGDCMVLWNVKLKHEQCSVAENYSFRPIRAPEQIAAEERESHINGMLCHDALGGTRRGLAEALYDAGYRRVEQ